MTLASLQTVALMEGIDPSFIIGTQLSTAGQCESWNTLSSDR